MDLTAKPSEQDKPAKTPSPLEFDTFLPWAVRQLRGAENVNVKKTTQAAYVSVAIQSYKSRAKLRVSKAEPLASLPVDEELQDDKEPLRAPISEIQLTAIYDSSEHLVQLLFKNNKKIPRLVFKIINLIIQYHRFLNTITINRGLDEYTLYEVCNILPFSQITNICLDNTFLKDGNYYILLEQKSTLRHLSLKRCGISDAALAAIANTLIYPSHAAKTLSILNLASNRITDEGAKCLSGALRCNRKLSYLNLSDNSITDIGGNCLLDTLMMFPLTFAEVFASRSRQMEYLKIKKEVTMKIFRTLRVLEFEKRNAIRKSAKQSSAKSKGPERENSFKNVPTSRSLTNMNKILNEKAVSMAEKELGEFTDPFDKTNTKVKDTIVYCDGNNTLCYLNLAYNNLTYLFLKKLATVLKYQKEMERTPRGLVNVIIEGNYIPVTCKELDQINSIVRTGLMAQGGRASTVKLRKFNSPH